MSFWHVGVLSGLFLMACNKPAPMEQRIILHPNKSIWKSWVLERKPNGDSVIQGAYKEFYWGGSPSEIIQYKEGTKEGSAQAWYDNGSIKWTKIYHQGKRAEIWRLYTSDGRPRIQLTFENGEMHGPAKFWDKNDTNTVSEAKYEKGKCFSGACGTLDSLDAFHSAPVGNEAKTDAELFHRFFE